MLFLGEKEKEECRRSAHVMIPGARMSKSVCSRSKLEQWAEQEREGQERSRAEKGRVQEGRDGCVRLEKGRAEQKPRGEG